MSYRQIKNKKQQALAMLHSGDPERRLDAAWELTREPDPAHLDIFIDMLNDEESLVVSRGMEALKFLNDYRAVKPLFEHFKKGACYSDDAENILHRTHDPRAFDTATSYLDDTNPAVRYIVVSILGHIGKGTSLLLKKLHDPAADVRYEVCRALYKFGRHRELIEIIEADECEEREPRTPKELTAEYDVYGSLKALFAREEDEGVKYEALSTMSRFAAREDAAFFIDLIEKDPKENAVIGALCLNKIIGKKAVTYLRKALQYTEEGSRLEILTIMAKHGSAAAYQPLLEFLYCDDYYKRGDAARALADLGKLSAVRHIINVWDMMNHWEYHAILRGALMHLGPKAVPIVVRALEEGIFDDYLYFAKMKKEVKNYLEPLLKDKRKDIREFAAKIMEKL